MAITGHPRLWLTEADLPRLRSWADASNPVYETGLKPLAEYAVQMAANDPVHVPADDNGSSGYTPYPTEMYAHLFAFMALISSDASTRDSHATRRVNWPRR